MGCRACVGLMLGRQNDGPALYHHWVNVSCLLSIILSMVSLYIHACMITQFNYHFCVIPSIFYHLYLKSNACLMGIMLVLVFVIFLAFGRLKFIKQLS